MLTLDGGVAQVRPAEFGDLTGRLTRSTWESPHLLLRYFDGFGMWQLSFGLTPT
jgi:hypothetical protein